MSIWHPHGVFNTFGRFVLRKSLRAQFQVVYWAEREKLTLKWLIRTNSNRVFFLLRGTLREVWFDCETLEGLSVSFRWIFSLGSFRVYNSIVDCNNGCMEMNGEFKTIRIFNGSNFRASLKSLRGLNVRIVRFDSFQRWNSFWSFYSLLW